MKVLTVDFKAPNAPEQFAKSMKETGFAVLINHAISNELIDKVYAEWETFFTKPEEEKRRFMFKRDYEVVQDGFFPIDVAEKAKGYDVKDLKEFYHAYPCGRLPEGFSESTMQLRNQLMAMGKILLVWLQDKLPQNIREQLSMPLTNMVDDEYQTLLRILHYPPLPDHIEPGAVRAAAHEDINLITLLVAATAPGLQVKDTAGKWHDVPCSRNAIVVNAGDMLQECTQNYFCATSHQVVNPSGLEAKKSRYSIPLFVHPKNEVVLSNKYTAGSYLKERMRQLGLL